MGSMPRHHNALILWLLWTAILQHPILAISFHPYSFRTEQNHYGELAPSTDVVQTLAPAVRPIITSDAMMAAASSAPQFHWKASKTPQFVTSKMRQHETSPVLTVFPSAADVANNDLRSARSRDVFPAYGASINGAGSPPKKRIIYYATLPEVPPKFPTSEHFSGTDYTRIPSPPTAPVSPLNQQRSYDPSKVAGQGQRDFVTRVQSSLIQFQPKPNTDGTGSNANTAKSANFTPSFTIIDAPLPQHSPFANKPPTTNRISSPLYSNYPAAPYYPPPLNSFKNPYPYPTVYFPNLNYLQNPVAAGPISSMYYGANPANPSLPTATYVDKGFPYKMNPPSFNYPQPPPPLKLALPQQQSSPYYGELEKSHLVSPAQLAAEPPPYPSRHTRFPMDRYPASSPLTDITASRPPQMALPPSQPPPAVATINDDPPPSSVPVTEDGPTGDTGPNTFDHNEDLDYKKLNTPYMFDNGNRFNSEYNFENLGNKYLNLHTPSTGYNNILPPDGPSIQQQQHFSQPQVSDWLANKPFEFSNFDLDDFKQAAAAANAAVTAGGDYQVNVDTNNQNGGANSSDGGATANMANTVITPFTNTLDNNAGGTEETNES